DEDTRIVKDVRAGARPFEMTVETTVTNLAKEPKRHQLSIGTYSYRTNAEVKGSLGRVSPFQTELSCAGGSDVVRKSKDDFASGWFAVPSVDRYAAVNTHYFAQALIPQSSDTDLPRCEILAEDWVAAGQAHDADDAGSVYHARLVYPPKE